MKGNLLKWTGAALLATNVLGISACSTTSGTEKVTVVETADGAMIVDTFTMTATVAAIDANNRQLTLVQPSGYQTTYKCGPEVVNFSQIAVGDQVKATVTEEVAVYMSHGAPPSAKAGAGVALAPVGAKPGGMMVATEQVRIEVVSVDTKARKVTLKLADDTTKTVKVGKQVNLADVKPGDNLTAQVTQGIALSVQAP